MTKAAYRYRIEGNLILESDLHIGGPLEDKPRDRYVSPVLRGADNMPLLPGTSLKGVLRSILPAERSKRLFGTVTDHTAEAQGEIGTVWLRTAKCTNTASLENLAGLSARFSSDGVFEKTRVAIDADRGTADENRLFTKDIVAAGAIFRLRFLKSDGASDPKEDLDLVHLLRVLGSGFRIGAGTNSGNGLLSLDLSSLEVIEEYIGHLR